MYFQLTHNGLIQNISQKTHGFGIIIQYGFHHGCCNKYGRSNDGQHIRISRQIDVVSDVRLKYA